MIRLIQFILILVTTSARSRLSLQVENSALRHQLSIYRKSGQRPVSVRQIACSGPSCRGYPDFRSSGVDKSLTA